MAPDAGVGIALLRGVLASGGVLRWVISRLRQHRWYVAAAEHDDLAERFLLREPLAGTVQLQGVLLEFGFAPRQLAYNPIVAGRTTEVVRGVGYDSVGGLFERRTASTSFVPLCVPASKYPRVTLEDGSVARVAWLYPRDFDGLVLPVRDSSEFSTKATEPLDVFSVHERHRPLLCLLPVNDTGRWFGHVVSVVGRTTSTAAIEALVENTDAFVLNALSQCLRPFSLHSTMLAIDLREMPEPKSLGRMERCPGVLHVQGVVSCRGIVNDELSSLLMDCIPDRNGMGPLRAANPGAPNRVCVLSNGRLRWVIAQESLSVGVFAETDLQSDQSYTSAMVELASHWGKWQRDVRHRLAPLGGDTKVTPVLTSDPAKLRLFHPGGLSLPPWVESELSSSDPSVRHGIDWLRAAAGR